MYVWFKINYFASDVGDTVGIKMKIVSCIYIIHIVAHEEIKMFALLAQLYPEDFVDFFIRNYFQFLDHIFHKW